MTTRQPARSGRSRFAGFDWASVGAVLDLVGGTPLGWLARCPEHVPEAPIPQPLSDQRPLDAP